MASGLQAGKRSDVALASYAGQASRFRHQMPGPYNLSQINLELIKRLAKISLVIL